MTYTSTAPPHAPPAPYTGPAPGTAPARNAAPAPDGPPAPQEAVLLPAAEVQRADRKLAVVAAVFGIVTLAWLALLVVLTLWLTLAIF